MFNVKTKLKAMEEIRKYREELKDKPRLRQLFLELTLRCNERCLHCGSSCGEVKSDELTLEQYKKFLNKFKEDFGIYDKMICITGGEPLLRKDFFEIVGYIKELGFNWGMTSNATLITPEIANRLYEAGMSTISVSIDGLRDTHDAFRRTPGGYDKAMQGIQNLINVGKFKHVQVTTVVTHQNISELDELFKIFDKIDINSWRVINIEPMGRAKEHPELLLTAEDYKYMIEFIRNKRINGEPVEYGCSHYLGLEYEHEIRDWYFMCSAGYYVASIATNGDILACLDIERRPELVQGNILKDDFKDIWFNKFKPFRTDLSDKCSKCKNCEEKDRCHGDSYHSWNFDKNEPNLCFKGILF